MEYAVDVEVLVRRRTKVVVKAKNAKTAEPEARHMVKQMLGDNGGDAYNWKDDVVEIFVCGVVPDGD